MTNELDLLYGRQQRMVMVLSELLGEAGAAGMPVVRWSVSATCNLLTAMCFGATDVELRATFEAWTNFLGAKEHDVNTDADGVTAYRASRVDVKGCRVMVYADVYAHSGYAYVGGGR